MESYRLTHLKILTVAQYPGELQTDSPQNTNCCPVPWRVTDWLTSKYSLLPSTLESYRLTHLKVLTVAQYPGELQTDSPQSTHCCPVPWRVTDWLTSKYSLLPSTLRSAKSVIFNKIQQLFQLDSNFFKKKFQTFPQQWMS